MLWLYEKKILELEVEFEKIRKRVRGMHGRLTRSRTKLAVRKIRAETVLILAEGRVLRDQVNLLLRLGKDYDAARLHQDFIEALRDLDSGIAEKLVEKLSADWQGT